MSRPDSFPPADGAPPRQPTALPEGDASLLALVDQLSALLERSDLAELEVEAGGTALVLRKPGAILPPPAAQGSGTWVPAAPGAPVPAAAQPAPAPAPGEVTPAAPEGSPVPPARPSIKAPLTGIFYGAPAPGSAPYVRVGGEVAVGQVIGLIEAMKLFNEIKSDLAGHVVKVVAENGQLVKAKQPLLEVEPQ
jgi:acetyl-CoA carboxylase biotin carboxyl carrier protein